MTSSCSFPKHAADFGGKACVGELPPPAGTRRHPDIRLACEGETCEFRDRPDTREISC